MLPSPAAGCMRRLLLVLAAFALPLAGAAPSLVEAFDVMPDGFVVRYHLSETAYYASPDVGTTYDIVRHAVRDNYAEFLDMGFEGGWPGDGHVYMDDRTGAQCVACVVSNGEFQIHYSILGAPRTTVSAQVYYPSYEAQVRSTIGHETFHNFQHAYIQPTGAATRMSPAFMEGLGRMQETLHSYSWAAWQPMRLVYQGTINGCNNELAPAAHPVEFPAESPVQWNPDGTLAEGPATNQSYSACDFWLSWYGHHGDAGLVALHEAAFDHRGKDGWEEMRDTIQQATGSVEADLARFAVMALTGQGIAFHGFDWAEHLGRWTPETLQPGGARTQTLADGGMMGAWIDAGTVSVASDLPVMLVVIGEDGTWQQVSSGTHVEGAWAVAILPGLGRADVTLSVA